MTKSKGDAMRGPIDFIIVGFEGPKFDGRILKALGDAIDAGVIALVKLSLIRKDKEGNVTNINLEDSGDKVVMNFAQKYQSDELTAEDDDISETSDLLENDTAAGLLMIEHVWARPLKRAIISTGGVLVAEGRIHPEADEELSEKEV
jgi:hypothetical protein